MDAISLEFKGLDQMIERMESLSAVARERALRSAMWPSMKPVLDDAKRISPKRSGAMAVAMTRAVQTAGKGRGLSFGGTEKGLVARVVVTPKRNNRQAVALYNLFYKRSRPIRGIFYGHMLEWGTKRGVKPHRFMSRAITSNSQRVINIFAERMEKAIRRELKRR